MNTKKIFKDYCKGISMEKYISYETNEKKTKAQWEKYYNKHISHEINDCGWDTFNTWWKDMTKDRLIIKEEI